MYYSKNYRKFIENRQKKIDKFIVNCIGWNHINRCIEVVDMAMRDLIYKIVPTKVVIRELKTSSGKILTKDSEYILVEKKKFVRDGKKTHVDYVFELDLKEDSEKLNAKAEKDKKEAEKKRQNIFYINLEDFNIVKLKATIFLIQFPISFTLTMINVWLKTIPNQTMPKNDREELSKEDIENIIQAKHAIKEFTTSLVSHLKNLTDYLSSVMEEKLLD